MNSDDPGGSRTRPSKVYGVLAPRTSLFVSEATARSMRGNKPANTKPELALRKALWAKGVRGYRLHTRVGSCTPDLLFTRVKVAVFVHGCFWHGCPACKKKDGLKRNAEYWTSKIDQNVARDSRHESDLKKLGFIVVLVWECQIRDHLDFAVANILHLTDKKVYSVQVPRNPRWSRDELLITLKFYFDHGYVSSKSDPRVVQLSEDLRSLTERATMPDPGKFRNINGVCMKLANFTRFDPAYRSGYGLSHGGRLEGELWERFNEDRVGLEEECRRIRGNNPTMP